MKKLILIFFCAVSITACNNQPAEKPVTESTVTENTTTKEQPPVELLLNDSAVIQSKLAALAAFERKDADAYVSIFDDNVAFRWSGGDSLMGKKAVKDFYIGRFNLIDTIKFSGHIFLPIMANKSPNGEVQAGKWLLDWYQVNVKYKNGKKLQFWVHNAQHYNASNKVDECDQYIDRLPLMAAMGK